MVIMGINMLGWIPVLRKLQIRFPQRVVDKINKKILLFIVKKQERYYIWN